MAVAGPSLSDLPKKVMAFSKAGSCFVLKAAKMLSRRVAEMININSDEVGLIRSLFRVHIPA